MRVLGGLDIDAVETERGDFRLRREKVCPVFWPILIPHTTVFLFRCKDNIVHDYSRYCDPSMGKGEYSVLGTCSE